MDNELCCCFKQQFENFLLSRNFKWHQFYFIKYQNGIVSKIFLKENLGFLDVIVQVLPDFFNLDESILYLSGYRLSILMKKEQIDFCFSSMDSNNIIEEYYNLLVANYDKMFVFDSLEDYIRKFTKYCEFMSHNKPVVIMQYGNKKTFYLLNHFDLVYIWYKLGKLDECKEFALKYMMMYKDYLYRHMKYDNRAMLSSKYSKEQKEFLDNIYLQYINLREFSTALIENNFEYLNKIESKFQSIKNANQTYFANLGY